MKFSIHILAALCGTILLSGCAISYQNENRRGLLGVAWVEYTTDVGNESATSLSVGKEAIGQLAPLVQQKTLGVYFDLSHNTPGIGFGYRDVIVVVPEVNAETLVDYDTSDPLSSCFKINK